MKGQDPLVTPEDPSGPPLDQRHRLAEEVFSYRASKDRKVFLFWNGQQVKILKGPEAQKFLTRIAALDPHQAQLLMAKATGNFKRGNER